MLSKLKNVMSAGRHRIPLCFCSGAYLLHRLLFHGLVPVDIFEVRLVLVLYVFYHDVLHFLWDDDHGSDT